MSRTIEDIKPNSRICYRLEQRLPMNSIEENEPSLRRQRRPPTNRSKWWNQTYRHQKYLEEKLESMFFRALDIFLVVFDTALLITEIMLEYFKLHFYCGGSPEQHSDVLHRINLVMEIAHFSSIGILSFFLLELILTIYVSGKYFWNFRKMKMEYFDAIIVIVSLTLDIYFLSAGKLVLGEEIFVIFSLRLWRFVRIIGSVAEGIRHGEAKHKRRLNEQYVLALQRLIELHEHKTFMIIEQNEDPSVVEHFRSIDLQCRLSLDQLSDNSSLTSSSLVKRFIESLNGIESINTFDAVAALLGKRKNEV